MNDLQILYEYIPGSFFYGFSLYALLISVIVLFYIYIRAKLRTTELKTLVTTRTLELEQQGNLLSTILDSTEDLIFVKDKI